jgi:hypothetical protein
MYQFIARLRQLVRNAAIRTEFMENTNDGVYFGGDGGMEKGS